MSWLLSGLAALGAGFIGWRVINNMPQVDLSRFNPFAETEEEEEAMNEAPKDVNAWRMLPERFPPGTTFESISADNQRIRAQRPAGFNVPPYTHTGEAGAKASSLLSSMPFGGMTQFTIADAEYVAIKEWHAPHVPPVPPPYRWHHGISVFQKK